MTDKIADRTEKGERRMGQGKASTLKHEIYDSIMKDIVEGVYRQNEIINEKQLIEKYGVSKSPIRDALIELCNEGVLISHPRYGYEIVRINEKEIRDIIDFRVMVESQCLRAAAMQMSEKDIEDLKEYTMSQCRAVTENLPILKHWDNNMDFHLKLLSYSGNEYCYKMVHKSIGIMTRAYAQRHWERWGISSVKMDCETHLKIVDYLMEGNVDASVLELKKDIESFMEILYPERRPFFI